MEDFESLARSSYFKREGDRTVPINLPMPQGSAQDFQPGQIIDGKYRIISILGRGGMGTVYEAYHEGLKKSVALKTIQTESLDQATQDRFKREAKALASFTNPHVVQIYDFGVDRKGQPYFTMELLEGRSLDEVIRTSKRLPQDTAIQIMLQVASALQAAHQKNIVHRDLKPANIFLNTQEQGFQVKIVDFGIAKLMRSENLSQENTESGIIFGSPLYMSPEQGLGRETDARTDIYSFGCTLFEALTGRPPFKGETAFETIFKHCQDDPPTLRAFAPSIDFPSWLETLIKHLLKKEPADRVASMQEVVDILQYGLRKKQVSPGRQNRQDQEKTEAGKAGITGGRSPAKPVLISALLAVLGFAACFYFLKPRPTATKQAVTASETAPYNKADIEPNEIRKVMRIFALTDADAAYINSRARQFPTLTFDNFKGDLSAFNRLDFSNIQKIELQHCSLDKKCWHKILTASKLKNLDLEALEVPGEKLNDLIKELAPMGSLESINLNYFPDADDETVEALQQLKKSRIQRIALCHDSGISAAGLAKLADSRYLHIDLNYTNLDDQSFLKIVESCRNLSIDIRRTKVTTTAMGTALRSGHIKQLTASGENDAQEKELNKLRELYPNQVSGKKYLPEVATFLGNGKRDQDVATLLGDTIPDSNDNLLFNTNEDGTYCKIASLESLDDVARINQKNCTELSFADFTLKADLLRALNLKLVTKLYFYGTTIDDDVVKQVLSWHQLQELRLSHSNLSSTRLNAMVSQLSSLPKLRYLFLDSDDLDDQIIDLIIKLPNKELKRLSLSSNRRLTSSALARLSVRPWHRLDLSNTQLDDRSFKTLAKNGGHINIDIRDTNVTARAVRDVLSRPNSIDSIRIAPSKGASEAEIDSLFKSYPKQIIDRN